MFSFRLLIASYLTGGPTPQRLRAASEIPNETNWHAFLYDGSMHNLGTLDGFSSKAAGINNSGQVVGDSDGLAFLYDAADGMIDLNTLIDPLSGWQLLAATGINDAGQIVGYGLIGEDEDAFLLTPVPEPRSFVLTILVVISVLTTYRRRWRIWPSDCSTA